MMLGMDMMGGGRRLPRNGLLLYLARPNSDEYLVGEDTEAGEDTYIWGYVLPDDAEIRLRGEGARILAGLLPGPVVGVYPRPTLGRPRAECSARWDLDAVVAAWAALRKGGPA